MLSFRAECRNMAHGSFGSRHGQFRSHAARFLIPSRTLGFSNETLKPGGPLYLKPQADSDQLVCEVS